MKEILENQLLESKYQAGFESKVNNFTLEPGLNAETVNFISKKKEEPEWILKKRLSALELFWKKKEPDWSSLEFDKIDYQAMSYYSEPKQQKHNSLDEIDPEILATYNKLGIPLEEQKRLSGVAVDAVFDSVSIATTFQDELAKYGVIFCPMSIALQKYPDLVKKYIFSVVPPSDNKFACLNSAVFSDGSFVYIPPGVKCPLELSTYFRINEPKTGQFERTLIVADVGSEVSYLEGCTAPARKDNQLHAAVVELVALDNAKIKYSTVQNWYPGNKEGNGGVYNFVTKRGLCKGKNSSISWLQVEVGSSITWKYPSCILQGDGSKGNFQSISVSKHKQQVDTGTKMIHIGQNTKSNIVSKSISLHDSLQLYRGLVHIKPSAKYAHNYTRCDSLILDATSRVVTIPKIEVENDLTHVEHEASASKIQEEQLYYCMQRGMNEEEAVNIIVSGFCKEVIKDLPMEFALEARKLLSVVLEGTTG